MLLLLMIEKLALVLGSKTHANLGLHRTLLSTG